jgi:VIT1/CCC1 family predicted Fe2+/Mn2+ transporter
MVVAFFIVNSAVHAAAPVIAIGVILAVLWFIASKVDPKPPVDR